MLGTSAPTGRSPARGEPHQRRFEVDVGSCLLGAGCAAGELVLVAGPRALGDSVLDPGVYRHCEFGLSYTRKLWMRVKRKAAYLPG